MDWGLITKRLFEGFGTTVGVFAITLAIALPLGLLIAFCSLSKLKPFAFFSKYKGCAWLSKFAPISFLSKTFVWIMRGTPLMLQLFVVYFGFPYLGINLDEITSALLAFGLNYAAYFSEIYRGGIIGISRGQYEAGAVLGLTKTQCFRRVVLPQVGKNILQPMSNEIITLVKDTSLVSVIAVVEITRTAKNIAVQFGSILPLFYSGIFYLLFNGILTLIFGFAEKKLKYYR